MDFIPYKVNEYLENTFYQVPKELLLKLKKAKKKLF